MTAQPREPGCPFCGVTPRETDATNFPGTYEHPWEKKGCPLDGVQLVRSDWAKRAPASRPDPLAARLVELRAKATPAEWWARRVFKDGADVREPDRVSVILLNDDARLAETLFANLDAIIAALADRDRWRAGVEAARKIAQAEVDRHNTGSGFDSHPAYVAACRIESAIRALSEAGQ